MIGARVGHIFLLEMAGAADRTHDRVVDILFCLALQTGIPVALLPTRTERIAPVILVKERRQSRNNAASDVVGIRDTVGLELPSEFLVEVSRHDISTYMIISSLKAMFRGVKILQGSI